MRMKNGESIQDYISRVLIVTYHIRSLGEDLTKQTVVGKILCSLSSKFRHVVSSIIEAKDLSTFTMDELSGSLKGHESRLDMETDQVEVRAFHTKGESSTSNPTINQVEEEDMEVSEIVGEAEEEVVCLSRRKLKEKIGEVKLTFSVITVRSMDIINSNTSRRITQLMVWKKTLRLLNYSWQNLSQMNKLEMCGYWTVGVATT